MADLLLIETGNGGDLSVKGNDLAGVLGFENMIYLALFGGNPEASTKGIKLPNEEQFDYWANHLLMPSNSAIQFNSETERTFKSVALNSSGRLLIEQAIKKDLEFMQAFAEVTIATSIVSTDRIEIKIYVKEPNNSNGKEYKWIWDSMEGLVDSLNSSNVVSLNDFDIDDFFAPDFY